jgi:hypothetical protein
MAGSRKREATRVFGRNIRYLTARINSTPPDGAKRINSTPLDGARGSTVHPLTAREDQQYTL